MTHKVYVVTDLGLGDGGKGGIVQALASKFRPHTVIKRGGGQGHHGVCTSRGERFAFRNWGCGTLDGVPTHISEQFTIHLEIMRKEAGWLRYEHLLDPFSMITVDERVLMATELHMVTSRLRELARGGNPRGTIGTGVGVANRLHQTNPELSIHAGDISSQHILCDKLFALREFLREDLKPVLDAEFLQEDLAEKERYEALLYDDGLIDFLLDCFSDLSKELKVVSSDYMADRVLARPGVAVVETSHGVLGDAVLGFQPHVSAIRTIPIFTNNMLRESGYSGQIVNLAVHRAYSIRHGAGPLPTSDPAMNELLLPGSNKDENRWQGKVRVGPLDFVQVQKAVHDSLPIRYDGLAVTWFDQIIKTGVWRYCHGYNKHGAPQMTSITLSRSVGREELFDLVQRTVKTHTGLSVRMLSFGPTERDKLLR